MICRGIFGLRVLTKGVVKDWNITAFPTVYVMDHTGMIVAKNPTNTQLEAMLGELGKQCRAYCH